MNTSEKQISAPSLLNQWDKCSPIAKPGRGSVVNLRKSLSSNPPKCEYRGISACCLPIQPQCGSWGEARTGFPGDVHQWLSCHGKEGIWGGSTCGGYSSVTNFHQTWNSLYPKPRPNPCERYHKTSCVAVTHTLCSVIVMASWFRENGSWDLHAQHTVMWWRGVVLMSRRATFAISNPCHYICSKKSVRCLLSLREQDNNLLSKVLKRKLLRYLFYSLVHKPRFFTSYKLKFQRFSQGKI